MKLFILSMMYSCLLTSFFIQTASADRIKKEEKGKVSTTVMAKCHVVLINGNEDIAYWRVYRNAFSNMTSWMVGKMILPSGSIKKVKVYQAHECVLDGEKFTHSQAKALDEKTLQ